MCHRYIERIKRRGGINIALIGNPNVGKSSLFNKLTGLNVATANYPGTTVDIYIGTLRRDDVEIGIVDLPGIYGISAFYEDQWVARKALLEEAFDAVIVIVDASNLQRNLYLVFQLMEMGLPLIICLNKIDYAEKMGLKVDYNALSKILMAPVIPTIAIKGYGINKLLDTVIHGSIKGKACRFKVIYNPIIEEAIEKVERLVSEVYTKFPYRITIRSLAISLLNLDPEYISIIKNYGKGEEILERLFRIVENTSLKLGRPVGQQIAVEKYILARRVAAQVTSYLKIAPLLSQKLDQLILKPKIGFPIVMGIITLMFTFIFYVGGFLEGLLLDIWATYVTPGFTILMELLSLPKWSREFLNIGFNLGMQTIISIMVPYIATFFMALSIIEDSGILPRIAYFIDAFSRKIGLSGRAIIPMLGGFGCNVPAIMATRVLHRRERLILAFLITMIPCSARTAVILGVVLYFLGLQYTIILYSIIISLIIIVGKLLHILLPKKKLEPSLILELPPLQMPIFTKSIKKAWMMISIFILRAVPILILGSFIIAGMQVSGILNIIVPPLSPLMERFLGLPAITAIPLIYGFIRKEGALILLAVILGTSDFLSVMTSLQLFTYTLIISLYVPCLATIKVLADEFSVKTAIVISIGTFIIAILIGGIFYNLNPLNL